MIKRFKCDFPKVVDTWQEKNNHIRTYEHVTLKHTYIT